MSRRLGCPHGCPLDHHEPSCPAAQSEQRRAATDGADATMCAAYDLGYRAGHEAGYAAGLRDGRAAPTVIRMDALPRGEAP